MTTRRDELFVLVLMVALISIMFLNIYQLRQRKVTLEFKVFESYLGAKQTIVNTYGKGYYKFVGSYIFEENKTYRIIGTQKDASRYIIISIECFG